MNKNTGDGELDDLLDEYADAVEVAVSDDFFDRGAIIGQISNAKTEAKTAIQKWAAQEANKAQQNLLKELMEQAKGKAVGYPCVPLSVIQNKLEGLS